MRRADRSPAAAAGLIDRNETDYFTKPVLPNWLS